MSLQWFRNNFAPGSSYDALTAEGATSPIGAQGLSWLPYLMGERTPHLDASCRAAWVGLTAKHTRADLIRAILEGISFSQKDCLEIITGMGVPVSSVRVSGGGAKSPFWRQMLADVFDKPVATLATQEGSAYGAALLALAGEGRSVVEVAKSAIAEVSRVQPDGAAAEAYRAPYEAFRGLYPKLYR